MPVREKDKDDIRHHIDATFRAYIDRDWEALRAARARDWIGFTVDADSIVRGNRSSVSRVRRFLRDIELIDYEMIEIDYAFHGSTCVVPYIARLRGKWASGGSFEARLRVVDVYAQWDDAWHQVAGSISLHPDTLAHPHTTDLFSCVARSPRLSRAKSRGPRRRRDQDHVA